MMDESTITIGYRDWRAEPRGKLGQAGAGDCIDCKACVAVCPMGIDIRDGQQMACITCGLCIDACDGMMDKIGRARGLVGYFTLEDEAQERQGAPRRALWRQVLRPRTVLYTALWALVGLGLTAALALRSDIDMTVAPLRNPLFITQSDGTVRNIFEVRLRNMHESPRRFTLGVSAASPLALSIEGVAGNTVTVPADSTAQLRLYLDAPPATPTQDIRLWAEALEADPADAGATSQSTGQDAASRTRSWHDSRFNGPQP